MAEMFCTSCGSVGEPVTNTPGSFRLELFLWLMLLLPGLIYSVWRLTARRKVCATCSSATLIPVNSPVALSLRAQMEKSAPSVQAAYAAPAKHKPSAKRGMVYMVIIAVVVGLAAYDFFGGQAKTPTASTTAQ
ncbi:hypothetical protein [Thiomonas sp.]|uniref:hypothetical protein n=1 Tax=Thiomonas sp. TaxID=2047785 RepID=UPI00258B6107|nr:hypothetical protein [Thiomonas sp.]